MKPTLGRIIHVRLHDTEDWSAAIVVATEGLDDHFVVRTFENFLHNDRRLVLAFSEEGKKWRWPPKV